MLMAQRLVLFVLILFSATHCASPKPEGPKADIHSVVLFVPGFYGSGLADAKTGDRFFLTFGQALWGKTPLALTNPNFEVPDQREFKVDGLLDSLSIVPLVYSVDIYGGTFGFLTDNFSKTSKVEAFPYDWRQDTFTTVKLLDAKIKELRSHGFTHIALVSHSYGGVIVSYYLRYGAVDYPQAVEDWSGAKKVEVAVLAGSPFRGTTYPFRNVHTGTSLGPSKIPLSADSLSTFPSMYQLMSFPSLDVFLGSDLAPLPRESLYDFKHWAMTHWGLLRRPETLSAEQKLLRATTTQLYLSRSKKFRELIEAPPAKNLSPTLPVLVIVGKGSPTFSKMVWSGKTLANDGEWIWDEDVLKTKLGKKASLSEDGDGTITAASATPPLGFQAGVKLDLETLEVQHVGMYTDSAVKERVGRFLTSHGF